MDRWLVRLRRLMLLVMIGSLAVTLDTLAPESPTGSAAIVPLRSQPATLSLLGSTTPHTPSVGASAAIELGLRFETTVAAHATGARFYKGRGNTGPHHAILWSPSGRPLARATFRHETTRGWQRVRFAHPVPLRPGLVYTIAYTTTSGHYAVTRHFFRHRYTHRSLVAPPHAGVYSHRFATPPTRTFHASNYFVDVLVRPAPASTPASTSTSTSAAGAGSLDLPRIPWEGGPSYYTTFPNARDWTNPSFLPIGIWFNGISSDSEVAYDKAHGINFYSGMWEGTDFSLFQRNGVYWVGDQLNDTFDPSSPNWPGVFMDDEVDGRYSPADGLAHLQAIRDAFAGSGKFLWANYSQLVIGGDMAIADQEAYVNDVTDVVSADMYWYTIPFCDTTPYRGDIYADPVPQSTCRTASSYGRTLESLSIRDAADGRLQPRWGVVENLNGMSGDTHVGYITPDQLQGAAMSAIIHEARGLLWFNQSITGPCETGSALRQAQVLGTSFCGYAQMQAMGAVNNFIEGLAPVINTQSYRWTFGPGLDTMLKTEGGDAYVFAMTDGTSGTRTFSLPPGITGTRVQVVGEDRTLPVIDHSFVDSFAQESTYHVYRIPL